MNRESNWHPVPLEKATVKKPSLIRVKNVSTLECFRGVIPNIWTSIWQTKFFGISLRRCTFQFMETTSYLKIIPKELVIITSQLNFIPYTNIKDFIQIVWVLFIETTKKFNQHIVSIYKSPLTSLNTQTFHGIYVLTSLTVN